MANKNTPYHPIIYVCGHVHPVDIGADPLRATAQEGRSPNIF
jgi:hypothetical protein